MSRIQLGFLGAGNMASAIINGILSADIFPKSSIHIYDISEEKCAAFQEKGITAESDPIQLTESCDMIFLAVKPQNMEELLSSIRIAGIDLGVKIFTSIAAGISTSYIQQTLGVDCPVIRAMPNTPLLIGQGATALCKTANVPDSMFDLVHGIFSSCGMVHVIDEAQMNAVISVNGSSPAYIYLFAKAAVDYAASQGIDPSVSLPLFCQTLKGSAAMLTDSGHTPEELIRMVSSPGGTTLAALDVFYQHDFSKLVAEAMDACTRRAGEIGK